MCDVSCYVGYLAQIDILISEFVPVQGDTEIRTKKTVFRLNLHIYTNTYTNIYNYIYMSIKHYLYIYTSRY